MKKLRFHIVDVFAEQKFSGNQLAVFRPDRQLSDAKMQQIALEMNYSETTFILSGKRDNNGYDVRIFTPKKEVPFAGHPVLGTAYVIQKEVVDKPVKKVKLNLPVGQTPVSIKYRDNRVDRLWMKQDEPDFAETLPAARLSKVLGLPEKSIDSRYPVQVVSTGLPFVLVPLKSLKDVKQAQIDRREYTSLISEIQAKAVFIFCPEAYDSSHDFNARMFADYYGIPEDPATGSANGCLAGYLVKYRYLGSDSIHIKVEQGYEMYRPSLLYLRAAENEGKIEIQVGGKAVTVASGEFD